MSKKNLEDVAKDVVKEEDAAEETNKSEKKKTRTLADGRKLRYGSLSVALTAVVVAAVVLLNIFANILDEKYPLTIDVSGTKMLSMSDTFKEFASSIDQKVHITVCIDEESMKTPNTGIKELDLVLSQFYNDLKQLKSLSNGNVTYEFVDLNKDVKKAAALEQYEVQSGSILFKSGEQAQTATYSDLFTGDENFQQMMTQIQYYGDTEVTEYTLTSNVEQLLCTDIQIVQNANLHPITILTGHGEDEMLISGLTALLTKNGYEVKTLAINTKDTNFDPASTMAIIPAPSKDYTAEELTTLRSWVSNNGAMNHHLVYVVDYKSYLPTLSDFFADDYGIEVTPYWAAETSSGRMFASAADVGAGAAYFPLGDVADTDYTSAAEGAVKTPFCVSLNLLWSDDTSLAQYTKSIVDFPETCRQISLVDSFAYEEAQTKGDTSVVQPALQTAEKYPMSGMAYSRRVAMVNGANASTGALVCGSSTMLSAFLDDTSCDNEKVFLEALNGINGNAKGTFIPGKDVVSPHIDFGTPNAKKLIGIGIFTLGIPALLLVTCLVVFIRRKNL